MPVSRSRSFAFIHVRKAAGTSISNVLERLDPNMEYNDKGMWDILCAHPQRRWMLSKMRSLFMTANVVDFPQWHLPAAIVRKLVGSTEWERLFTFAFVRNPWDRVVSAYHFERRYTALPYVVPRELDRVELLRRSPDFDHFVRLYPLLEPTDMGSMLSDDNDNLLVNFVGRFENLRHDFGIVARRLGIDPSELPHENRTEERRDYRAYYTPETRALVERYFAADIERFGYSF